MAPAAGLRYIIQLILLPAVLHQRAGQVMVMAVQEQSITKLSHDPGNDFY